MIGPDLVAGEHLVGGPGVVGVERHELDEADLVGGAPRELGERQRLLLGEVAQCDRVDLDRVRLRERAQHLQAPEDLRQRVAASELVEAVLLERVDRHVEAVDPGAHERLGVALEQEPVGRDRQVLDAVDAREHLHKPGEFAADERLAAGQTHVVDAHPGHHASRSA